MFVLILVVVFLVLYYLNSVWFMVGVVILLVIMFYQLFILLNGLGMMYCEFCNVEVNLQLLMVLVVEYKEDFLVGVVQIFGVSGFVCDNLYVVVGGCIIIYGILVQILVGIILVVVGLSGFGKFMFLKCLVGLYEYLCGSFKVGDLIVIVMMDGWFLVVFYVL